jgi:pimeloyl-ACP methyl ester carboxylesterase
LNAEPQALWRAVEAQAEAFTDRFRPYFRDGRFSYQQPLGLQGAVPARLRRAYETPVAYTEWGPADAPLLVCLGGVANTAMRFCALAQALAGPWRVVCMDWLGRGYSGWLADDREYALPTYVEQLRQLVEHLQAPAVSIVGSSLGGSVAIEFAARYPQQVGRLVLNDVGPSIPRARRLHRAETLARFYVFRDAHELLRRVGASHKNDGPLSDEVRLFLAYHQTRWSAENGGRVYRHDPRAMLAYQRDAQYSVDQWAQWREVRVPVLLLHGMLSDALMPRTMDRMRRTAAVTVVHVPGVGHTPALWSDQQTALIREWLSSPSPEAREFSLCQA